MRDFIRKKLFKPWFHDQFRPSYTAYTIPDYNENTMAAQDLGNKPADDLPPPPSEMIADDMDALIAGYLRQEGITLGKTRRARMKSRFKALVGEWFIEYTSLYFPEDTNHLISSYNETFRNALANGKILIQSDLFYAGLVEEMEYVEWTKSTTKDHAVAAAKAEIRELIPRFLDEARRFALE